MKSSLWELITNCVVNKILQLLFFFLITWQVAGQANEQQIPPNKSISILKQSFADGNWNICVQQSFAIKSYTLDEKDALEVNYIHTISALKAKKEFGPELASNFLDANKGLVRSDLVKVSLGDFHFDRKEYVEASKAYDAISVKQISRRVYARSQYFNALSAKYLDAVDRALEKFKEVTYFRSDYREKSAYYAGYIYYEEGNLYDALRFFLIADESEQLQLVGVIADVYYRLGQRKELISYINNIRGQASSREKVVLNRLLGEVYFEENSYKEASEFFTQVITLSNQKTDPGIYYKLAYSHDQLGEKEKALEYYKVAALDKSELGQLSSFRSGELYLELENFEFASLSFRQAGGSDFNFNISEQAKFLSGKCEISAQNYDKGINTLLNFISEYPNSQWQQEASDLLAEAWLRTSNYDRAIDHIEKLSTQTSITKKTYQRVTFMKGQQLFNSGKWNESSTFLDKSLKYTPDRDLLFEARYLLVESAAILDKKNLMEQYQRILNLSADSERGTLIQRQSRYALGYLYYNVQDYKNASVQFERFLTVGSGHPWYHDGRLRLADCLYALKRFSASEDIYRQLLQTELLAPDYLLYQLGMIHYQQNNNEKSISHFNQIIEDYVQSPYVDKALFQKGQLLFESTQFDEAKDAFDKIIMSYPTSRLVLIATMRRGLCSANLNNYSEALESFKYIVMNYPTSTVTGEAILGIQDLQKKGFSIPNFDDLLATFKQNNPENTSLESLDFEQIKTKYFNQQYDALEAITRQFENDYPNSNFLSDARYYLADGFFRIGNFEKAIETFDLLIDRTDFDFYPRVLDKRGKTLLKLGDSTLAIDNYRRLQMAAQNTKETYLANEGLMLAFVEINGDSAFHYAQQIIESSWKPLNAQRKAQLVQLRILMDKDEKENSFSLAETLIQGGNDEVGAEASFLLAKIYALEGDFEQSNETLFQLLQDYGSLRFWTDQAYLLIVENYLGLGELLQAQASTNAILENSKDSLMLNKANALALKIEKVKSTLLQTNKDSLSAGSIPQDTLK